MLSVIRFQLWLLSRSDYDPGNPGVRPVFGAELHPVNPEPDPAARTLICPHIPQLGKPQSGDPGRVASIAFPRSRQTSYA